MHQVSFHKVTELPTELEKNSIYLIDLGEHVEMYITTNNILSQKGGDDE